MNDLVSSRWLAAILLLTACAAPGLPPLPQPALPEYYPQADAATPGAVAAARWWTTVQDPVLDRLIDLAQHSNHDVRIALARVAQARALVSATDSRTAPQVSLGGDAATSRSSLPAAVKFGMPDTRALQLNATLGWELDLMGAAAAAGSAARADFEAARWNVRGVEMMTANEVARQYLNLKSLERSRALVEAIVTTFDLTERLLTARIREGTATRLDLDLLRSERESQKARLPLLAAQQAATRNALALLLGLAPGAAMPLPDTLPPPPFDPFNPLVLLSPGTGLLGDPGSPPVGQPADLLLRRPDLQAAAFREASEEARRREAHADRYPRFFLSALLGGERLTLNSIPYTPAQYSNAALAFSMPLIDGQRLAALETAQAGKVDEAGLAYQQQVLRAVQEVDSGLALLKAQREQSQRLVAARDQAVAALEKVRLMQAEGEADGLAVLQLVRTTFLSQAAVLDAEHDRGLAAIQLYAALGGGWLPSDAVPAPLESAR